MGRYHGPQGMSRLLLLQSHECFPRSPLPVRLGGRRLVGKNVRRLRTRRPGHAYDTGGLGAPTSGSPGGRRCNVSPSRTMPRGMSRRVSVWRTTVDVSASGPRRTRPPAARPLPAYTGSPKGCDGLSPASSTYKSLPARTTAVVLPGGSRAPEAVNRGDSAQFAGLVVRVHIHQVRGLVGFWSRASPMIRSPLGKTRNDRVWTTARLRNVTGGGVPARTSTSMTLGWGRRAEAGTLVENQQVTVVVKRHRHRVERAQLALGGDRRDRQPGLRWQAVQRRLGVIQHSVQHIQPPRPLVIDDQCPGEDRGSGVARDRRSEVDAPCALAGRSAVLVASGGRIRQTPSLMLRRPEGRRAGVPNRLPSGARARHWGRTRPSRRRTPVAR